MFRWFSGRRGWRARGRQYLIGIIGASTRPVVLRRVAGNAVAARWSIIAHRTSHLGLVTRRRR